MKCRIGMKREGVFTVRYAFRGNSESNCYRLKNAKA